MGHAPLPRSDDVAISDTNGLLAPARTETDRRAIDSEMTACGDDGRLCWKDLVMAGKEGTYESSEQG